MTAERLALIAITAAATLFGLAGAVGQVTQRRQLKDLGSEILAARTGIERCRVAERDCAELSAQLTDLLAAGEEQLSAVAWERDLALAAAAGCRREAEIWTAEIAACRSSHDAGHTVREWYQDGRVVACWCDGEPGPAVFGPRYGR